MDPDLAIAALAQAVAHDTAPVVVADVDWPRFLTAFRSIGPAQLLQEIPETKRGRAEENTASEKTASLKRRLASATGPEHLAIVHDFVRTHALAVLGLGPDEQVDPERSLLELGADSMMAVQLRGRLNDGAGVRLPPTVLFDHPTLSALTHRLRDEIRETSSSPPLPDSVSISARSPWERVPTASPRSPHSRSSAPPSLPRRRRPKPRPGSAKEARCRP
jgi:acyl carrier protein